MAIGDPTKGTLVEFTQDCAPYCKGDVVKLDEEAKKYVDNRAKKLDIGSVYKAVGKAAKDAPTE